MPKGDLKTKVRAHTKHVRKFDVIKQRWADLVQWWKGEFQKVKKFKKCCIIKYVYLVIKCNKIVILCRKTVIINITKSVVVINSRGTTEEQITKTERRVENSSGIKNNNNRKDLKILNKPLRNMTFPHFSPFLRNDQRMYKKEIIKKLAEYFMDWDKYQSLSWQALTEWWTDWKNI